MTALRHHRSARRGASMLEALAAVTIGAILLSLAAMAIVGMLRRDADVLRRTSEGQAQTRLALTLREDAHDALRAPAEWPAAGAGVDHVTLDLGQEIRVEYRCRTGWVQRQTVGRNGVESTERFRLDPQAQPEFRLATEQGREFLCLRVVETEQGQPTPREYELWAALPRAGTASPPSDAAGAKP